MATSVARPSVCTCGHVGLVGYCTCTTPRVLYPWLCTPMPLLHAQVGGPRDRRVPGAVKERHAMHWGVDDHRSGFSKPVVGRTTRKACACPHLVPLPGCLQGLENISESIAARATLPSKPSAPDPPPSCKGSAGARLDETRLALTTLRN